jgi:hypothetical protein
LALEALKQQRAVTLYLAQSLLPAVAVAECREELDNQQFRQPLEVLAAAAVDSILQTPKMEPQETRLALARRKEIMAEMVLAVTRTPTYKALAAAEAHQL